MAIKRSLVLLTHDEGYGDDLLNHINQAIRGKDMRADSVIPEDDPMAMLRICKEAAVAACDFDLASAIRDLMDANKPGKFSDPVFIGEHTNIHDEEMPPKDQRKEARLECDGTRNGLLAEHYEFWEEPGNKYMIRLWHLTAPVAVIQGFLKHYGDVSARKRQITLEGMDEIRKLPHFQITSMTESVTTNAMCVVRSVVAMYIPGAADANRTETEDR